MLARGEADLMIGFYDAVPPRHHEELIFDEVYTCIVRKGHPSVRTRLSLKKWVALKHVLVSQRADSPGSVDRALAARGLERTVAARVSHFLMVPSLVASTDMVAAVSRRIAEAFARPLGLAMFPPPIPLPTSRVGQVWHEQMHADPGHRWLRGVIAEESARF
jgi:DNA-binding transcriptional LysR family regulator